jgi:D-3-phosphoglycerate dehydrogenase
MIGPTVILEPLAPTLQATIREIAGSDFDLRFPKGVDAASFQAALSGAAYAVVRAIALPEAVLRQAPSLKLIHQWGTGVDGIPIEAAAEMGIAVARCAGVNAPTIADVTLALMLAVLRQSPQTSAALKNGRWQAPELWQTARDLTGAQVGLVGFGSIAQAVAKRLAGFDCQVCYWRPSGFLGGHGARFCGLDELLRSCDVVSLHIPLNDQTRGFLGAEELAKMKSDAVLINTATWTVSTRPPQRRKRPAPR